MQPTLMVKVGAILSSRKFICRPPMTHVRYGSHRVAQESPIDGRLLHAALLAPARNHLFVGDETVFVQVEPGELHKIGIDEFNAESRPSLF